MEGFRGAKNIREKLWSDPRNGGQGGAEAAAAFFSFFTTCRRVGADPQKWLMAAALAAKKDPKAVLTPAQFVADQAASS